MNDTMLQQFISVEDALTSLFGSGVKIAGTERVSGGDINEAYKLALTDGTCIFMKSNKKENAFFLRRKRQGWLRLQRQALSEHLTSLAEELIKARGAPFC